MTLQEFVAARPQSQHTPSAWAFEGIRLARLFEREVASPDSLAEVVGQLLTFAHEMGCVSVAGASGIGERLAGALVATSNNGLRLWSHEPSTEPVMFIDGVVVTGVQLGRAIRAARDAGVQRAIGVGVIARHGVLDAWRAEGVEVAALEELPA